jgi:multidrug resistance efflux pump
VFGLGRPLAVGPSWAQSTDDKCDTKGSDVKACRSGPAKLRAYSPANTFVDEIYVSTGQSITTNDKILRLDTSDLEMKKARYEVDRSKLARYSEQLTPDYTQKFLIAPIDYLLMKYSGSFDNANRIVDFVHLQVNVGHMLLKDLEKVTANLDDMLALISTASESKEKKTDEITSEQATVAAQLDRYSKMINLVQKQIGEAAIDALADGCVVMHVEAGIFVERGDLLFDVV